MYNIIDSRHIMTAIRKFPAPVDLSSGFVLHLELHSLVLTYTLEQEDAQAESQSAEVAVFDYSVFGGYVCFYDYERSLPLIADRLISLINIAGKAFLVGYKINLKKEEDLAPSVPDEEPPAQKPEEVLVIPQEVMDESNDIEFHTPKSDQDIEEDFAVVPATEKDNDNLFSLLDVNPKKKNKALESNASLSQDSINDLFN